MTREEAINHLKTVAKTAIDSGYDSAVVDAVDMAREALEQEPCGDAISREAVLDALHVEGRPTKRFDYVIEVRRDIKALPPVTPQPKTGHWIQTGAEELPFGVTIPELTCSTCGLSNGLIIPRNYCPKCGTKMAESEERNDKRNI